MATRVQAPQTASNTKNFVIGGLLVLAAIGTLVLAESINQPKK